MSKREIYAWCSLGFALAIFSYYLISVFGLPAELEGQREYITSLIWKVIGIAFVVELVLDLLDSTTFGGVAKDERDILIESKGFRNAYYFLMVALVWLIANVLISDFLSEASGHQTFLALPFMIFHVLVFLLFIASIIKSITQLIYYNKGI